MISERIKRLYSLPDDDLKSKLDAYIKKTIDANLTKGYDLVKKQKFSFAEKFFGLVLAYDKDNAKALIGMMYCDLGFVSLDEIWEHNVIPSKSKWYEKVLSTCDEEYKKELLNTEAVVREYLKIRRKRIKQALIFMSIACLLAGIIVATVLIISKINHENYINSDAYLFNITDVDGGVEIGTLNSKELIKDGVLEIPEYIDGKRVVGIGNNVFYSDKTLQKVVLPESITYIGENAFFCCSNLMEINLPSSLTKIGKSAFSDTALRAITIPGGVKTIEAKTFLGSKISTLIVEEGVTRIEYKAFGDCFIREMTLPSTLEYFGAQSFAISREYKVNIHINALSALEETKYIGEVNITGGEVVYANAFAGFTRLKKVSLCDSITAIEASAFKNCTELKEIKLSSSLKSIGEGAFSYCALTSIVIPKSVSIIGAYAFDSVSEELVIYCEISQSDIPSGWSQYWNLKSYTNQQAAYDVYWDYKK